MTLIGDMALNEGYLGRLYKGMSYVDFLEVSGCVVDWFAGLAEG